MTRAPHSDNDNQPAPKATRERTLDCRRHDIEAAAEGLCGRDDLLPLALEQKGLMRLTHLELVYLNERRKKANCGGAEQELIRREMHGSMTRLKDATDQFTAIEKAMVPDTRATLWHLVDPDDWPMS
jgi:hypothetical protein